MSMFWMPKIQKVFNVIPALACNNVQQPYWESGFIYPLTNSPPGGSTSTSATSTSTSTTKTTTNTSTSSPSSSCTPGSSGTKLGDGYNGYNLLLNIAYQIQQEKKTDTNLLLDTAVPLLMTVGTPVSAER